MGQRDHGENLRHVEAYEWWYWSSPRTFLSVARQFHVSQQSIMKWATKFRWRERAAERDEKQRKMLEDRTNQEAVRVKGDLLKVARATISRYAARLMGAEKRAEQGVTQYEPKAGEAARWAQIWLVLTGQATSRNELTLGRGVVDELVAAVTSVLRRALPNACPNCKVHLGLPARIAQELQDASARLGQAAEAQETTLTAAAGAEPPPPGPARGA